jgi:hypothetical protein
MAGKSGAMFWKLFESMSWGSLLYTLHRQPSTSWIGYLSAEFEDLQSGSEVWVHKRDIGRIDKNGN